MKTTTNTATKDHCCQICDKRFTLKRNVTKHLKVVHNKIQKTDIKNGLHCPLDCKPRFIARKYSLLREHIASYHGVNIECEELTFSTLEEFTSWKRCVEQREVCSYIAQTAPKRLSFGQTKTYYVCHRSGPARQASTGRRNVKYQGSCKVGTHCPSTLDLTHDEGKFQVKFHKTHAGHDLEMVHLKLTRGERLDLAGKIMAGESFDKILDDIRDEEDTSTRKHFVSRKDLHNVLFELTHGRANQRQDANERHDVNECQDANERQDANECHDVNANRTSCAGNEEVKRKLSLMLALVENTEMNDESYSDLGRTLDETIRFVVANAAAKTFQDYRVDSLLDAFPSAGDENVGEVSSGVPDCGNALSLGDESSRRDENIVVTDPAVGDLHLNVFRCAGDAASIAEVEGANPAVIDVAASSAAVKDLHLDVIRCSRKQRPLRRILPKTEASEAVRDLHLDVIRYTRDDSEGVVTTSGEIGDLHLDVFREDQRATSPSCVAETEVDENVVAATNELYLNVIKLKDKPKASEQLNVFRCAATKRRKRAQESDTITLRKRTCRRSSSIRVFAFRDEGGETTLDSNDFDQVYGIDV